MAQRIQIGAVLIIAFAAPLFGVDVYFNDFHGAVGTTYPEWTSSGYANSANQADTIAAGSGPQTVAVVTSPNGKRRFLGEFGGPANSPRHPTTHNISSA